MLIAEDLLLLLLDDERGTVPALWVDVRVPLGAALLAELALDGDVTVEQRSSIWRAARVEADPAAHPDDDVLAAAVAVVAEKPRSAKDLAGLLGRGLRDRLAERLAGAGVLERQDDRVLGLFPRTRWPAASSAHEAQVREELRAALTTDATPAPRIAALAGLLDALDRIPKTLDLHGAEARQAKRRAKTLAEGDWASKAVRDAIAESVSVATTTATVGATVAGSS